MNYFILLCGGKGERLGADLPKQYINIHNKKLFEYSLDKVIESNLFDCIIISAKPEYFSFFKSYTDCSKLNIKLVKSGIKRQNSVYNALASIKEINSYDNVFIHDSCRPYINIELLEILLKALKTKKSAIPYKKITNSIFSIAKNEYLNKEDLISIETPQCFKLIDIFNAHKKAKEDNIVNAPDDGYLFNKYISKPNYVENIFINNKITYVEDINIFNKFIENENKD
jgi:2-C-methyl-D-erythritol 4-phosphate cytidylyltransferase